MPAKPAPTTTTSSSVVLSSSTITVTPLVRRACRPLATSVASVTHAGRRPSTDRSIVSRCDQTRSEVATAEQLIGHHVAEQRGVLGRHRVADDDGLAVAHQLAVHQPGVVGGPRPPPAAGLHMEPDPPAGPLAPPAGAVEKPAPEPGQTPTGAPLRPH